MYKMKKFILIFEPDVGQYSKYDLALQNSGYHLIFAKNVEEFIGNAMELLPEVLVFNETHKDVDTQKVLKIVRKDSLLDNSSILMLVDKIGHATTVKAKTLKAELEVFPINNHHFLQMIKKLSSKVDFPEMNYENAEDVLVASHIDIVKFNQLGFSFRIPIKLTEGSLVKIKAQIFERLGIFQELFTVDKIMIDSNKSGFLCYSSFVGLSQGTLKKIKSYKNGII